MYRIAGPQPFGLPVSDANHHHSYRSSEDEDRPHHKKPDLRRRASQKAEQKQLALPLQNGPWRTHDHVHREKPYIV
ncbi:hypothetical protein E2C01_100361 [Portunus trituberculatus]|uniref:Uncharacterized protein n=1 Tax=Portunus trituberculatus TaxID=210409 RepID=A0A5B7K7V1_PORTR|nr:hypothetical protein [Portunus trituberculatus]